MGAKNTSSTAKLMKNTTIYMIGSMMSKLLNLIILPYISGQLTPEQYGIYDLVQTIVGVALPIFTLQAIEAAFRFVYLEKAENKGKIITNVWTIILTGTVLFTLFLYGLNVAVLHLEYVNYLAIYFVFNVFLNMYQRIARCYDNYKVYALSGVIQTFVLLFFQLFFLQFFGMNEDGLIYAYAVSVFITCVYIHFAVKEYKTGNFRDTNKETIAKIVRFSAPLIPNSISWWGVSSLNRVLIVSFISYSANGIYSMSNKFASIVTVIASTFQLAWQEYALTEKDNPERVKLFSQVFAHFTMILMFGTGIATLFQQMFFSLLINPEYAESFYYIPLVMLGVAFSSLSSFYGAGYFVYEKTKGAFKTTVACAVLNLILCFLSVFTFGLYGISMSGVIAYLVMWLMRHTSMRSYFKIEFDWESMIVALLVTVVSVGIYYCNNVWLSLFAMLLMTAILIVKYFKLIKSLLRRFLHKS